MEVIAGFILAFILIFTLIQFIFTILENLSMNSPHENFQDHSMERRVDSEGNVTHHNWKSDFPYNVVEGKYLCNDTKTLTSKELTCAFDNAEQIKEDLANHSEKWNGFYNTMYAFLWIFWIVILISMFTIFIPILTKDDNSKSIFSSLFYSSIQALLAHTYMTTALLQSVFIIFEFDDNCIYSDNRSKVDLVYRYKNTGLWYFSLGFLFLGLYFGSLIANAAHVSMMGDNSELEKGSRCCLIIPMIFIEVLISIELFIELSYFQEFNTQFPHKSNDYMELLIYMSLLYHVLVSYILPVANIIHLICGGGTKERDDLVIERIIRENPIIVRRNEARRNQILDEIDNENDDNGNNNENTVEIMPAISKKATLLAGTTKVTIDIDYGKSMMFCTICLDAMTSEDDLVKITECNHIFHKKCIGSWGDRNMSCPMCRSDIC